MSESRGNQTARRLRAAADEMLSDVARLPAELITWQPAANLFPNGQRTQAQTIVLNEPGSLFSERWNQLDINIKKNIHYGHNKVHTFQFDIFNVFNSNAIRTMTDTVGTSLGQVTAILPGRFPRIAYQFKW